MSWAGKESQSTLKPHLTKTLMQTEIYKFN